MRKFKSLLESEFELFRVFSMFSSTVWLENPGSSKVRVSDVSFIVIALIGSFGPDIQFALVDSVWNPQSGV